MTQRNDTIVLNEYHEQVRASDLLVTLDGVAQLPLSQAITTAAANATTPDTIAGLAVLPGGYADGDVVLVRRNGVLAWVVLATNTGGGSGGTGGGASGGGTPTTSPDYSGNVFLSVL